ncbi:hypothetical protein CCACVL1_25777 [Corchorus capsularis]|uniref:Uncharacterized protein n=1 Tax=Corchorus capsularis TaxID=210143 RepID=A0A1R3GH37_COCAP|nr:hypothetical protein CCACVL1_25777 [Corchorus capsularis]
MGIYSTAMEVVMEVTGLSPAGFFTIIAMMVVVYKIVCGMFIRPEDFELNQKKSQFSWETSRRKS